jgi:hypothetical protein
MRVKVTNNLGRNGRNDVWYRNRIGEVFFVGDKPDQFDIYRLDAKVHGKDYTGKGIHIHDCMPLAEIKIEFDKELFEI